MEESSRWHHFWQGFWKGLGGLTIPSVFSESGNFEPQKISSGKQSKSADFNDCFNAVGDDMRKVLADFDHVLERELKNQAAQDSKTKTD